MHEFTSLVDELTADESVAGLVLGGSRGRDTYVRGDSDWDLYVVLHDGASVDDYAARYPSKHGDRVEVLLRSRDTLADEPASNRYTFCHVEPLLDRSGAVRRYARGRQSTPPPPPRRSTTTSTSTTAP
jgi:predicted nucleotidyltransferase